MGATVEFARDRLSGGEWISPVVVRPGFLRGIRVAEDIVPSMIDELPLLACVATRADGETVITGAAELRVKESDRIAAVVANLRALGAEAWELEDGMRIVGSRSSLRGSVKTHGDHRLAMSFGVLGALPGNEIHIDDPDCVAVSYPGFWSDLTMVSRR
jgi:3-phosphoshikimate 1-carboxyvinyltransferase